MKVLTDVNLDYFGSQHQSEIFRLKGIAHQARPCMPCTCESVGNDSKMELSGSFSFPRVSEFKSKICHILQNASALPFDAHPESYPVSAPAGCCLL